MWRKCPALKASSVTDVSGQIFDDLISLCCEQTYNKTLIGCLMFQSSGLLQREETRDVSMSAEGV